MRTAVPPVGIASQTKHGLEILGIGIADIDLHDRMMLRTEQTPGKERMVELGENSGFVEWYPAGLVTMPLRLLLFFNGLLLMNLLL